VHVQAMGWDERMTLYTEDLSLGGAFLRTTRTIERGTYLQLTFVVPNRKDLLAFAEVVREVPSNLAAERATSAGIGVHYLDPDPLVLEGMGALIEEIASLAPRAKPAARAPDTFEGSEDDYRAAADGASVESATGEEELDPPTGDDWWAASVDQLNRHRILKKTDQGAYSPKEPAFDPLGSDLPADPQGARPDVQKALAEFAASIGHTPEAVSPREPGSDSLPTPKLDRNAPQVFESKPKAFLDVGKTIELYERCMKLIESRSYGSAHQLAQDLLALQPNNKKFLVAMNLAAGGLYKSHGDLERATLHFQDAADLDETCKIAIEELRAVGMSRRQQKNVKSGLLARLKDKRKTK
jgi:TolA-binding protein